MLWKISSLCTSLRTKSSLTIKTDDITSSRRDVDLHIQAVTGDSGENGLMRSAFHLTKTSENLETVANGMEILRENFQKVPESLNFWNANHSTKSCKVMWRTKHANVRAVSCGFVYHKINYIQIHGFFHQINFLITGNFFWISYKDFWILFMIFINYSIVFSHGNLLSLFYFNFFN